MGKIISVDTEDSQPTAPNPGRVLLRVLLVQVLALILLALLQTRYHS